MFGYDSEPEEIREATPMVVTSDLGAPVWGCYVVRDYDDVRGCYRRTVGEERAFKCCGGDGVGEGSRWIWDVIEWRFHFIHFLSFLFFAVYSVGLFFFFVTRVVLFACLFFLVHDFA